MDWFSNKRLSRVLVRGAVAFGLCLVVAAILDLWGAGTMLVVIGVPVILTMFILSKHYALRQDEKRRSMRTNEEQFNMSLDPDARR